MEIIICTQDEREAMSVVETSTARRKSRRAGTVRLSMDMTRDLHRRVRVRAAEADTTITRYVTEMLEQRLSAEGAEPEEGRTLPR